MGSSGTANDPGFWRPSSDDLLAGENENSFVLQSSLSNFLPISAHRTQILYALEKYGVLVLVGETGCGKSTQIPQFLYENGWADSSKCIICTQPRRIAAMTLADRVASEIGDSSLVGYSVRFASTFNPATGKIRFVTDGWLLRETTLADPLLKQASVLIIDEAHERSLNTELLLGVVKKIRRVRPELRVVVCSATLDAESFLEFFCKNRSTKKKGTGEATTRKRSRWGPRVDTSERDEGDKPCLTEGTIISVDGRQHPVDILYQVEPVSDYVKAVVDTALRIHESSDMDGDILCFLTTGEEVDEAVEMAETITSNPNSQTRRGKGPCVCLPLYAGLPANSQRQPFLPKSSDEVKSNSRRIIFSTNIAETSVTVPNIAHVVDCGFAKEPYFDPDTGFDRLITCAISKASAKQRAGRSGRVMPGKCYRLFSEKVFESLRTESPPEIQRCNLTSLILTIKALGVSNVLSFDLMSVPSVEALAHGVECLYALGALDDEAELTELGKEMVYFSTEPRVSRMLLAALDMESREETPSMVKRLIVGDCLTVAASIQVRNLFLRPRTEHQWRKYDEAVSDILDRSGDHVTMLHLFDLVDHTNKMLTGEECRERFVNRIAMQRVLDVRSQLARFLHSRFDGGSNWFGTKRQEVVGSQTYDSDERSEAVRRCITSGFFMNVAKLGSDGQYYSLRGNFALSVSSTSVLHRYGESSDYIVFGGTYDANRGGVDCKPNSTICGSWLRQLAPHYWQ